MRDFEGYESHSLISDFHSADAAVQWHIHAGLRCAPTTKTYKRWNEKRLAELQNIRDEKRAAAFKAIEAGEIKEKTRLTKLREAANGLSTKEIDSAIERNKSFEPFVKMSCEGKSFEADVKIDAMKKTDIGKLFKAVI